MNNLYRSATPIRSSQNNVKKLNFKTIKHNTICSLNDVEYFLNNLNGLVRYIKLYKLLR